MVKWKQNFFLARFIVKRINVFINVINAMIKKKKETQMNSFLEIS